MLKSIPKSLLVLSSILIGSIVLAAQDDAPGAATPLVVEPAATDAPGESDWLQAYRPTAIKRWESSIQKLEQRDETEATAVDPVLFVGSSSIRLWKTIVEDMAPYHVIQRGYGGAKYSDLAIFSQRLIHPHHYRALVMFVANDVSGSDNDASPEEVERLVRYIVGVSHAHQPGAPVLLIEVTPTQSRWRVWPTIRQVNGRLREIALDTPNTYFIPTAGHYLRPDGNPRTELFVGDQLHLNRQGYELWGSLVRRRLDDVFRLIAVTPPAPDVAVENPEPSAADSTPATVQ